MKACDMGYYWSSTSAKLNALALVSEEESSFGGIRLIFDIHFSEHINIFKSLNIDCQPQALSITMVFPIVDCR
jgi:hypothetical protein